VCDTFIPAMSLNRGLADRLEGIRRVLVEQGRAARSMSSATKGREREIFVNEFLSKVFPPQFRLGNGDIIDSSDARSGQVDLVVELPFFPSFPIPGSAPRLYLAEGVAAAIEVKSDLGSQWNDVMRTTAAIKKLVPKRIRTLQIGRQLPTTIPVIAVGYEGYATADGLTKRMLTTPDEQRPDVALILDDPALLVADQHDEETFLWVDGPEALFVFLARMNWYLTKLITAGFSVDAYMPGGETPTS
jgi:hypothetical protein